MDTEKTYRVGDKVVCGGYLYRIFKVDSNDSVIFFRPYFRSNKNTTTVRKIPVVNLDKTNIREPMSKKQAVEILSLLKENKIENGFADLNEAKDLLLRNDLYGTVKVLRWLWQDKQDEDKSFTLSKKRVYDMAIERLMEEIAYVHGITLEEAEEKIHKHLKFSTSI